MNVHLSPQFLSPLRQQRLSKKKNPAPKQSPAQKKAEEEQQKLAKSVKPELESLLAVLQQLNNHEEGLYPHEPDALAAEDLFFALDQEAPPKTAPQNMAYVKLPEQSLLAGNFSRTEKKSSPYLEAKLNGLKVEQQLTMQMASKTMFIPSVTFEEFAAEATPEKLKKMLQKASEKYLKQSRNELERKAQEALIPRDASGRPLYAPAADHDPEDDFSHRANLNGPALMQPITPLEAEKAAVHSSAAVSSQAAVPLLGEGPVLNTFNGKALPVLI